MAGFVTDASAMGARLGQSSTLPDVDGDVDGDPHEASSTDHTEHASTTRAVPLQPLALSRVTD
jgi:hypothetical protein